MAQPNFSGGMRTPSNRGSTKKIKEEKNRADEALTSDLPDAVLFDWDGTLIDSGDILLQCWHVVTTQVLGAPFPITEDDRRKFLSMRGADSFPLLSEDPVVVAALDSGFTNAYFELASLHVRPQPTSHDLLSALRSHRVSLGVVTSKTRLRFECDLDICQMNDIFDVIITGDDVAAAKPDPEGVRAALAALGVPAETSWMVGDGPVDVLAGRAGGMHTAGISHGLHSTQELIDVEPDVLVPDLADLAMIWGIDLRQKSGQ
jgi:HAD superfamily hydrolase (TIGR01509 family)